MSNSRSPKDIRQIVSDSNKDMSDMQNSLEKLKNLAKDDKTENAMLRSRIDEQSQLIMILKQRADEVTSKTSTIERINKELIEFRDNAKEMLDSEIRKYNMLNKRFDELAYNHEEMIKFKDEYKRCNKELREENARLKEENTRLFSSAMLEKDEQIAELGRKLSSAKEQQQNLELRHRQNVGELRNKEEALKLELKSVQEQYKFDIKSLQSKLNEADERLKAANYKLQNQIEGRKNADTESQTRIQTLTKEKDELLDLAMSRGKIIQKEQTENKKLQKRIEEMEKAVRNMEDKFEREASAVNANMLVRKLRDELDEADSKYKTVVKDFETFKKYSNSLLQREREINDRLKHLAE